MRFCIGSWQDGCSRVDVVKDPDGDVRIKVDNIAVAWLTTAGSIKRACLKTNCPEGITKDAGGDFIAVEDQQRP